MALLDAYATAAEYRARSTNSAITTEDTEILAQAVVASRALDNELGVVPGAFNQTAAGTARYFTGSGTRRIFLRDSGHRANPVLSFAEDGIAVDVNGDGTYSETFDLSDGWCVSDQADSTGEPCYSLTLLPYAAARISTWPARPRAVRITGVHGWSAVPGEIRELTIAITRDLRDRLTAGAAGTYQLLDSGIIVRDETWRTITALKSTQRRRGARSAAV